MENTSYICLWQVGDRYQLEAAGSDQVKSIRGRPGIWLFASSRSHREFTALDLFRRYASLQEAFDAIIIADPGIVRMHDGQGSH